MTAHRFTDAIMALDDERDELARRAEALAYAGQVLRRLAGVDVVEDGGGFEPRARGGSPPARPRQLAPPAARKNRQVKPQGEPGTRAAAVARPSGKKAKLAERVVEALASLGRPASIADVLAAANGGTRLSVRFALGELKRAGRVSASGANQQRLYSLASSRLPDRPTASVGSLSDGPGDEKQESAPAENAAGRARIEIGRARTAADWLQSRGYQVEALEGGRWRADRKTLDTAAMIALANRRRADLNMAPYVLRGVA